VCVHYFYELAFLAVVRCSLRWVSHRSGSYLDNEKGFLTAYDAKSPKASLISVL
jgi:hypothetical protein